MSLLFWLILAAANEVNVALKSFCICKNSHQTMKVLNATYMDGWMDGALSPKENMSGICCFSSALT